MQTYINLKRHLETMRDIRDDWLKILDADPDNLEAAQYIVKMNTQIEFIKMQRMLNGDYDD